MATFNYIIKYRVTVKVDWGVFYNISDNEIIFAEWMDSSGNEIEKDATTRENVTFN
jgi:hypothetical protein